MAGWTKRGLEILKRRESAGISRKRLAVRAGISEPTLLKVERGDLRTMIETVVRAEDALNEMISEGASALAALCPKKARTRK